LGILPDYWLEQIKAGDVSLSEDPSTTILVRQLLSNTVDGIDIEPSVINYYLGKLGVALDSVLIDKRYRYDVYVYNLSTIKHTKEIAEFYLFLKKNNKLIKALIKK